MNLSNSGWRGVAGALLTAAAIAGCSTEEGGQRLAGPGPETPSLTLQVSSMNARPGDRIAVSVAVDGSAYATDPLIGLKGVLSFDASRLEYLGQEFGAVFAIANEQDAERGRIVFANLELGGLNGRTATFVFAVRGVDYARGLRFTPDELVTKNLQMPTYRGAVAAVTASDLSVPAEPRRLSLRDWQIRYDPTLDYSDDFASVAGENVANLRYGDANLNGTINIAQDAFFVASVAVGNLPLIAGSDATPNRDVIVAGNPVPFNVGSATLSPGEGSGVVGAAGVFIIQLVDAAAIATDATNCAAFPVGSCPAGQAGNQPVIGDLVREAIPVGGLPIVPVSGNITTNTTWTAGNVYQLSGTIRVTNGATLTIEPGTRIEGSRPPATSPLFIERDGRIVANGTRTKPIVFTCTGPDNTKFKGCWAGLAIVGNAEINESNGTTAPVTARNPGATGSCTNQQNQLEGGGPLFGGCNNTDDSGVLRYVIVEYGGFETTPGSANELNNLTMGGVGSGTTIEYVQVRNGLDDGFEWFGGTVNHKYLVATHNSDDSFDFSFGYKGSVQFGIIQHSPTDSDKGFEGDNQNGSNHTALPRTTPVFYNITMIGDGGASPDPQNETANQTNDSEDALHIRKGSHPIIRNLLVSGFGRAFRMDNGQTCSYDLGSATDPSRFLVESSIFHNVTFLESTSAGAPAPTLPTHDCVGEEAFLLTSMVGNTNLTGGTMFLGDPFHSIVPDFRISAASPAATGGSTATPPAGITNVAYRGATEPGLGATQAPWWLGWTKGGAQQTP